MSEQLKIKDKKSVKILGAIQKGYIKKSGKTVEPTQEPAAEPAKE